MLTWRLKENDQFITCPNGLKRSLRVLLHHNFGDECVFVYDGMLSLTEDRLKARTDYTLSSIIKLVSLRFVSS